MPWTMERRWYSHTLEGQNPDWFSDSKLFLLRYLNIQLKKTFSKVFFIIGSKEIGL